MKQQVLCGFDLRMTWLKQFLCGRKGHGRVTCLQYTPGAGGLWVCVKCRKHLKV